MNLFGMLHEICSASGRHESRMPFPYRLRAEPARARDRSAAEKAGEKSEERNTDGEARAGPEMERAGQRENDEGHEVGEQRAMTTIRTTTVAAALIAMVMTACVPAAIAASNAEGLKASVEQGMERLVGAVIEAVSSIDASSEGEREEAVRGVVESIVMPNVDTTTIARRIVGKRHWANATPAQRATLTTMFGQWISTTYAKTIAGYSGEAVALDREATRMGSAKARIRFGVTIGGKVTKMGFELGIDQARKRWMIRDLDIDGISTVRMQRANLRPALAKGGIDGAINAWEAQAAGGGTHEGHADGNHWAPVVINLAR